ncbi:hypothetical protein [Primorskyibacter sp. S187A]|uniref:hypothetical protein n=1 Tax=Primorskyibacter sp. S187A TaxID=3415130 RepID=UPI003C79D43F
MSPAGIEYIACTTTVGDLRKYLSDNEVAAVTISSYCATDINSLCKLAWMSNFRPDLPLAIRLLKYGQEAGIIKPLTLRLLEFWKFLKSCEKQQGDVGEIASNIVSEFDHVESLIGHEVAISIRDKAAAHNTIKDAKRLCREIEDETPVFSLYSANRYNSTYTLGDEAFITGVLRSLEDELHTQSDLRDCWYEWTRHMSDIATVFHSRLYRRLVTDRMPDIQCAKTEVDFPDHFVFETSAGNCLPVHVSGMRR